MNDLVGDFTAMVRRLLPENVLVETRLAGELWSVFVDPHRIEQVLMNLAVNARDAMPEGGRLSIETSNRVLSAGEVSDLEPGEYVRVAVRDTGFGMDVRKVATVSRGLLFPKDMTYGMAPRS